MNREKQAVQDLSDFLDEGGEARHEAHGQSSGDNLFETKAQAEADALSSIQGRDHLAEVEEAFAQGRVQQVSRREMKAIREKRSWPLSLKN